VKPVLAVHTYNYDPGSHACTTRLRKFSEIKIYENWELLESGTLGLKPKGTPPDKPRCYGVVAKFEVLNGEAWRSFKSRSRHKVCPRPKW
jgi:hypothetical protein